MGALIEDTYVCTYTHIHPHPQGVLREELFKGYAAQDAYFLKVT